MGKFKMEIKRVNSISINEYDPEGKYIMDFDAQNTLNLVEKFHKKEDLIEYLSYYLT